MNRKLTREEAITLHREMWADMQAELGDTPYYQERFDFKKKWVKEHFPNEHVNSNCILCEYAEQVTKVSFTRCRNCPIAWNSSIHPTCNPGTWAVWNDDEVDYRYSPISVILALPEREVPLYLCDKKRDCNGPCYRYCRLTHDINHAVRDDEGKPTIVTYWEDPGDTWPGIKEVEK